MNLLLSDLRFCVVIQWKKSAMSLSQLSIETHNSFELTENVGNHCDRRTYLSFKWNVTWTQHLYTNTNKNDINNIYDVKIRKPIRELLLAQKVMKIVLIMFLFNAARLLLSTVVTANTFLFRQFNEVSAISKHVI